MAKQNQQDSLNGLVSRKTNEEIDTDNEGNLIIDGETIPNHQYKKREAENDSELHLED